MSTEQLTAERWVSVREATAYSGLGRSMLYDLMTGGRLAYSQVGSKRLIPLAALKALMLDGLKGTLAATSNG